MTEEEAFEIVMSLAYDNVLDEAEASQDKEILEPMMREQEEALEVARRFLAIHLHASNTPTRPL